MAERVIQATTVIAGVAEGRALVLPEPLSLWGGLNPTTGEIIDRHHPSSGENVTDRVLVLPAGRGSSSASSILLEAIRQSTAPAAILTFEMDGILALGAVVAQELYGVTIPLLTVPITDYRKLANGQYIQIEADGTIRVRDSETS